MADDKNPDIGSERDSKTGEKLSRTAHLKDYQFKSGADWKGNASGRPRKTLLTDAFEEMLEEKLNDPDERRRFIQAHWEKLLSKTVVSSMTLEKILDRTEGKVSQPVQVSGDLTVSLSDEIRKARQRVEGKE